MSKAKNDILKFKSFVEHNDVFSKKCNYFELVFDTSCSHDHPRKKTRQEQRQGN